MRDGIEYFKKAVRQQHTASAVHSAPLLPFSVSCFFTCATLFSPMLVPFHNTHTHTHNTLAHTRTHAHTHLHTHTLAHTLSPMLPATCLQLFVPSSLCIRVENTRHMRRSRVHRQRRSDPAFWLLLHLPIQAKDTVRQYVECWNSSTSLPITTGVCVCVFVCAFVCVFLLSGAVVLVTPLSSPQHEP